MLIAFNHGWLSYRMKYNIEQSVELIPTLATQLTIISSVKAATPNDISVRSRGPM